MSASRWGVYLVGLIDLPLVSAWSPARRVLEVLTLLYVPLSIAAILDLPRSLLTRKQAP